MDLNIINVLSLIPMATFFEVHMVSSLTGVGRDWGSWVGARSELSLRVFDMNKNP